MSDRSARVADVHRLAAAMPHVTRVEGPKGNAVYQVGSKSPRRSQLATTVMQNSAYPTPSSARWSEFANADDRRADLVAPPTEFCTTVVARYASATD